MDKTTTKMIGFISVVAAAVNNCLAKPIMVEKNEDSNPALVFVYPETINTRESFHLEWRSISLLK